MRTGSGQAGDSPAAGREAEPTTSSPFAAPRWVTWHGDLAAWVDRLGWLRTLSAWLTGVLGPFRERHQDNLALELLHGGRWVGHPLHPALSDLPIGLWAGAVVLDATDRDPAPRQGFDAVGMLSAAGILAACATALTGLGDWAVSNDQDRRVGLFHGLLNTAALGIQGASLGARLAGHRDTARALGVAGPHGHGRGRSPRRSSRIHQRCDGQPGGVGHGAAAVDPHAAGGRPAGRLADRRRVRGSSDHAVPPPWPPLRHRQHLQPRWWLAQPRPSRKPDRDLPAAWVPLRARHRLRQPWPG